MKNRFVPFLLILIIALFSLNTVYAQRGKHKKHPHRPVVKAKPKRRAAVRKPAVVRAHKRNARARRVAHVRYAHLPKRGARVTVVSGARSIRFRKVNYRFHNGVFYKPVGSSLVVHRAPIGIRIKVLPTKHRRIIVGPRTYYYYYGTYYAKTPDTSKDGDEYEVIDAPMGAEVDALPEGYTVETINGNDYYVLDSTYYEPRINDSNEEYYVVVAKPE